MLKRSLFHLLEERMKLYHLPLMPVIWGITCLVIGGLLAFGLYGYYSTEKAMASQFNTHQLMLAQQAARGIENFLADTRATATLLTRLPEVQNHEQGIKEETLRVICESFQSKVNFFFLENRRGIVISAYPPETLKGILGKDFRPQSHFQKARGTGKPHLGGVGNMAHEIKNPLGTIVLNAELLEEELRHFPVEETKEARNLLGVIKSELDHLIEVIEEYLQFARLPEVKLERGNVNEVIADLFLFLKEELSDRSVMVVEELNPSLPPVQLDPKQVRQALLNIVKNSLEAMPHGGKLTVSTDFKDERVEITIADTGRGIPEENMELVLRPFFSTKHGGTGLGLPITVHIVKQHRGTISFESYVGLGTAFTIRLPANSKGG